MGEDTHIRIRSQTWQALNSLKEPGDTFDDVVTRLLTLMEGEIIFRFEGEGPELQFVEVENTDGASISVGEWESDGKYQLLRVPVGARQQERPDA